MSETANKETKIKRLTILRYVKSGKLITAERIPQYEGVIVAELEKDMIGLKGVHQRKYLRSAQIEETSYIAELQELPTSGAGQFGYSLKRILTKKEIDPDLWRNTENIRSLPVSTYEQLMPEELAWAGHKLGNVGDKVKALGTATGLYFMFGSWLLFDDSTFWFGCILALVFLYLAVRGWEKETPPDSEKLKELIDYKAELRATKDTIRQRTKSSFEEALETMDGWKNLSPQQFELALKERLNKQGFKLTTTQFSSDGGIDLEGEDDEGRETIIQAKKYSNNVGVNVVREMIGVRQSHANSPRVIIYALSGFTRGAKELALEQDIELRDIKSELVGH